MVSVECFHHYCLICFFFLPRLLSVGAAKMPQVMVVARNFMDMVAALPAAKLDMLYDSAFICEAVLRSPTSQLTNTFGEVLLLSS